MKGADAQQVAGDDLTSDGPTSSSPGRHPGQMPLRGRFFCFFLFEFLATMGEISRGLGNIGDGVF